MRRLADAGRSTRDQSSFHLISILVTRIIDRKKKLFFVCNICLITTNVTDVEEIWQGTGSFPLLPGITQAQKQVSASRIDSGPV